MLQAFNFPQLISTTLCPTTSTNTNLLMNKLFHFATDYEKILVEQSKSIQESTQ